MSVSIKPLEDRIVVKALEAETTTASGIVIPDSAKEKPQEGEVIAVGPGRIDDKGNRVPLDIAVGDKVIYSKYGGTEVKYSGEDYLILSARDVLAIVVVCQPTRRWVARAARIAVRSSSDRPPHTPYGSRTASDCSRHCLMTGQVAQIAFAASARRRRAAPRSPSGWKNRFSSASRHAPWNCHSQSSMTGPGSREISAITSPPPPRRDPRLDRPSPVP